MTPAISVEVHKVKYDREHWEILREVCHITYPVMHGRKVEHWTAGMMPHDWIIYRGHKLTVESEQIEEHGEVTWPIHHQLDYIDTRLDGARPILDRRWGDASRDLYHLAAELDRSEDPIDADAAAGLRALLARIDALARDHALLRLARQTPEGGRRLVTERLTTVRLRELYHHP